MELALADTLIWRRQFDPADLTNRFVNWWKWGEYMVGVPLPVQPILTAQATDD